MNPLLILPDQLVPNQVSLWAVNVVLHATILTAISLLMAMAFRKAAVMRYWILCFGMLLVVGSPAISAIIQKRGNSWLSLAAPVVEAPSTDVIEDMPVQTLAAAEVSVSIADAHPSFVDVGDAFPAHDHHASPYFDPNEAMSSADSVPDSSLIIGTPSVTPPIEAEPAVTAYMTSNWIRVAATALMTVWLCGTLVLLVRMSVGWLRLSRILTRADSIENADLQSAFERACRAVNCPIGGEPRLVASDEVSGPIAAGIRRGTVVLPTRLANEVDASDLAEVLVHEVAHVMRRDQVVVLLQNIVAAFYWPHPLVKKLNRELAKAREEVCDNFVLAHTEAPVYSRTLLSLAQLVQHPETMIGSVGFFASRWKLEQRIAGLLDVRRDRSTLLGKRGWMMVGFSTLGLATLMCVGTITLATANDAEDNGQPDVVQSEEPDEKAKSLRGTVRGPDGKPLAGARVMVIRHHRANTSWTTDSEIVSETTSDREGRYELEPALTSARFSNGKYLEHQVVTVLATHADFGPDGTWAADQDAEVDLQLFKKSSPILGKVVDLEGQPIDNISVRLLRIEKPNTYFGNSDAVDKWAELAKANPASMSVDAMRDPFGGNNDADSVAPAIEFYPTGERLRGVGCLEIETKTNRDGEFQLQGVGDDQLAILRLDGPGIASTLLPVVARQMDAVNTPGIDPQYRTGKTYGNKFSVAAEPSQLVRGVIRDRETGVGIAGVRVEIHQFADSSRGVNGFLTATTDASGRYELQGLPRSVAGSTRSMELSIEPPKGQPYFRSNHDLPAGEGFDPIEFDINLTRGVWAEGQITDAKTGDPVPSIVGYHPYIDNPNAEGHESFTAGITSMGYRDMFATDAEGAFRVPALRGKGVVRVVAASSPKYMTVPVPGTRFRKNGSITTDKREIYHVIMPGNAVVDLEIQEDDEQKQVNVQLQPREAVTLRVVDPSGVEASGFYVGGQFVKEAMTLTGRGFRFWQDLPSTTSNVEVILGSEPQRNRPVILIDKDRALSKVVWRNEVDADSASPMVVELQSAAKIFGHLVDSKGKAFPQVFVESQLHGAEASGEATHFPLLGAMVSNEPGRFSQLVPSDCRFSTSLYREKGSLKLLDQVTLAPGETLDLGTINVDADPKTWPKPKRSTPDLNNGVSLAVDVSETDVATIDSDQQNKTIAGQVLDPIGKPISAQVWIAGPPRDAGWNRKPLPLEWSKATVSNERGQFHIPESLIDAFPEPNSLQPMFVRIAATAPGFGFAWSDIEIGQPNREVKLQLADDVPVLGKFVTTEGNPIADVEVSVVDITQPKRMPSSEKLIASGNSGSGVYTNWPMWMGNPPLVQSVVTDSEGSFSISGIGAERYLRLQAHGASIADTRLLIATRRPPAELTSGMIGVRRGRAESDYFSEFTHIAVPGRTVTGQVVDAESNSAIAGVRVVVPVAWRSWLKPATTDEAGRFRITGIPADEQYTLELSPKGRPGYFRRELIIKDSSSEDELVAKIALTKRRVLQGRVVDATSGEGVPASIQYNALYPNPNVDEMGHDEVAQPLASSRTNDDGTFSIPVLPGLGAVSVETGDESYAGAYVKPSKVERHFRGHVMEAKPDETGRYKYFPTDAGDQSRGHMGLSLANGFKLLDVDPDKALQPISVQVHRGGVRKGEIFDEAGKPLTGVEVIGLGPSQSTATDTPLGTSKFAITGLHPEDTRTLAFLHRDRSLGAMVVVKGGEQSFVRVTMRPTGSVRGKFVDSLGKPVHKLEVQEFDAVEPGVGCVGFWIPEYKADGTFRCDGLIEGMTYFLRVQTPAKSYTQVALSDIQATPGKTKDIGTIKVTDRGRFMLIANEPKAESLAQKTADLIAIRGRVAQWSGSQPISGAMLWLAVTSHEFNSEVNPENRQGLLRELGSVDQQGRFKFTLDATATRAIRTQPRFSQVQLVATVSGHGIGWMPLEMFDDNPVPSKQRDLLKSRIDETLGAGRFASRTLKLRTESQPVRGRLVDLEGNPLPNVTVSVESLSQPKIEKLLNALENSWTQGVYDSLGNMSVVRGLARTELQRLIAPVTTDKNGEFEIRGIGDDQLARIVFSGERVDARPVHVLAREMTPVSLSHNKQYPGGTKDLFVGRTFTHAAGPSIPVEGIVTDIDTGEPIPKVLVSVERLFRAEGANLRLDTHHMRAVTDEQGRFRIVGMPPGNGHIVEAIPPKSAPYLPAAHEVSLSLEDRDAKRIEIGVKKGVWIEGRITDKRSGKATAAAVDYMALSKNPHSLGVPGADRNLKLDPVRLYQRYVTNRDGSYRALGLPGPGVLLVTSMDPDYPLAVGAETIDGYDPTDRIIPTTPFPVPASQWHLLKLVDPDADARSLSIDLTLDQSGSIPGRAVGPQGEKITDLHVLGTDEGDKYWSPKYNDKVRLTDRFKVKGYDGKGPQQLFFKARDETLVGQFRLEGNAPEEIAVTLEPSVRVTGRLIESKDDLPAARYFLACKECSLNGKTPPAKFMIHWCHTDDDGRFEIKGLMAGAVYKMYALSESNESYKGNNFMIDLTKAKPGEVIELGDVTGPNRKDGSND